jgi:FMN phosphatase YigB (HAD superfamily)
VLWGVPRAVLYVDLDGTLALSPIPRVIRRAYEVLASLSGLSVQQVERVSWAIHLELASRSLPQAFDWDYILERMASELGVRAGFSVEREFSTVCSESVALDNSPEVLRELERSGYTLILASNGLMKYQRCVIETLGLDRYFNYIYTPDSRGCLKNCREFYAPPEEVDSGLPAVSVGDSYTFDVYFPKLFGLLTVHVVRSTREDPYLALVRRPGTGLERLGGLNRLPEADVSVRNFGESVVAVEKLLENFYRRFRS